MGLRVGGHIVAVTLVLDLQDAEAGTRSATRASCHFYSHVGLPSCQRAILRRFKTVILATHPSYERYATESDPAVAGASVAPRIRYALRHATRGAAFYGSRRSVGGHLGPTQSMTNLLSPRAPPVAYLGRDSHRFSASFGGARAKH